MNSVDQAKSIAIKLRSALAKGDKDISHSEALELVASTLGYSDWDTASAKLEGAVSNAINFGKISPIIRILMRPKQESSTAGFLASKSHLSIVTKSNCGSTWASSVPVRFYILQSIMATQAPDRTYFCQLKKFECFIRSFRRSSIPSGVLIWKNCRGACKSKCMTHLATEFGFVNKCPE